MCIGNFTMENHEVLKLANQWMKENSLTKVVDGKSIKTNTGEELNQLDVLTKYAKSIAFRVFGFILLMLVITIFIVKIFNLGQSSAYLIFMGPVLIYSCIFAINHSKISLYKTYNKID